MTGLQDLSILDLMTHRTNPTDPYRRIHIGPDHHTLIESTTIDLADNDPVAQALEQVGVTAVSLRFANGDSLVYSKRGRS